MEIEHKSLDQLINSLMDDKIQKMEARIMEQITGMKDETVGITRAMEITKLSKSTIYNLKNQRRIPCFKRGKLLLFSTRELMKWRESGRILTEEEMRNEN